MLHDTMDLSIGVNSLLWAFLLSRFLLLANISYLRLTLRLALEVELEPVVLMIAAEQQDKEKKSVVVVMLIQKRILVVALLVVQSCPELVLCGVMNMRRATMDVVNQQARSPSGVTAQNSMELLLSYHNQLHIML